MIREYMPDQGVIGRALTDIEHVGLGLRHFMDSMEQGSPEILSTDGRIRKKSVLCDMAPRSAAIYNDSMSIETLTAVHRSNQAYFDQIADRETLTCGIATHSTRYPLLADCNHLREVLIEDPSRLEDHWREVVSFYEARGLRPYRWIPSVEQRPEVLADFLTPRGFVPTEMSAMSLTQWPALTSPDDVRVVPARPMRAKLADTFEDEGTELGKAERDMRIQAGLARLDDSRMDMLIALVGGQAAGRGALFSVGDIGRVMDVYVCREFRGNGVATALFNQILKRAHRLLFRTNCLEVSAYNDAALKVCNKCGYRESGRTIQFVRTPDMP